MKRKSIEIGLSSKARVVVRRFGLDQLDEITELGKRAAKSDAFGVRQFWEIVDKQIVEVVSWGPYLEMTSDSKTRIRVPWRTDGSFIDPDTMLDGDFESLCAGLYVAKYGDEPFTMEIACGGCTNINIARVNVSQRLEENVTPYSDRFLEKFEELLKTNVTRKTRLEPNQKSPFEFPDFRGLELDSSFNDADGDEINFKWAPIVGRLGAVQQEQWVKQEKKYSSARAVAFKLSTLGTQTDRGQIRRELGGWDEDEVDSLLDAMAEDEGGLENVVEVDCNRCGRRNSSKLPFGLLLVRAVVNRRN